MTAGEGGERSARPLTHDSTRTLPLSQALALVIATIPDLAPGEAVDLDVSHARIRNCSATVVRTDADAGGPEPFEVEDDRVGEFGTIDLAHSYLRNVVSQVQEWAPTTTHATVRRRMEEQTTEEAAADEL